MRRADVDVGFRRHARVADGVRADKAAQRVLARDAVGVTEVLDQLKPVPDGQDLRALHILDVVGEPAGVAVVADAQPKGVFGRLLFFEDLGAQLAEASLDLGAPLLHLGVNRKAL